MGIRNLLLTALVVGALPASAGADKFSAAAREAKPLASAKGLTALFWSLEASCGRIKNDMMRRQCQIVKDARRDSVVGQTFRIEVSGPAVDVGDVSKKKKSVTVKLRSCVVCGEDAEAVVIGKGAYSGKGDKLAASVLATKEKVFKSEAEAEHWHKYNAPHLRAQFLVKVPARVERFKSGGKPGYKLDVVGYQLYEPCDGAVLTSKPTSDRGRIDAGVCKDIPDYKPEKKPEKPKEKDDPNLGDRLTTAQINDALKPVREAAQVCYQAYGIEGTANFRLVIAGSGKLAKAEQEGDFVDTPTGICLDVAIKKVKFPKSKKKETPVTYPIILR
jgi:hypothetical protein